MIRVGGGGGERRKNGELNEENGVKNCFTAVFKSVRFFADISCHLCLAGILPTRKQPI